ncbi:MAG: hypothetical protein J5I98_07870, partial [Phaeodactylibacter sp.]|nr:hypothetical protein [Phaeodactylibacter sp.]
LIDMKNKLKKTGVILFLLGFPLLVFGQKHDYVWMFGYNSNATSAYPGIEGVILDFNQAPPTSSYEPISISLSATNATISDSLGNLLFYTNGCSIADWTHQLMPNGDSINLGEIHDIYCERGYPGGTQSAIILPVPSNDSLYYLVYKWMRFENQVNLEVSIDTLYYALVVADFQAGKRRTIQKNIPIINEKMVAGQLTAAKHTNGKDWWLITGGDTANKYYSILFRESELIGPFEQTIGLASSYNGSRSGQAVFSPDATKYIRYSPQDGVFLFDFDRQNGVLSNFKHLPIDSEGLGSGVAVSPNSRYLYVSAKDTLFQFDLEAEDIFSSGEIVGIYDGFQSPFPTTFHNAQLAPDCKIYINTFATVDVLHVIHNPDEPGLACNFEQHAVQLPFNHRRSLPHFPNYRLGPLVEGENPQPPCEPIVSTKEQEPPIRQKAYVFPNPAPGYFKVVFEQALRRPGRVMLYNGLGQVVLEEVLGAGGGEFRIELSGVAPGLYFYGVFREGVAVKGGRLVVAGGR